MTSYANSRRAAYRAPTGADAKRGAHDPATTWSPRCGKFSHNWSPKGISPATSPFSSIVSLAKQNGLKPSPPSRYKSSSTAFPPIATGTPGTWPWQACDAARSPASAGPTSTSPTNSSTSVDVRGHALDQTDPKTKSAARTLPIPDGLLAELKAAKARQAAEQLAMGDAYSDHGHVVCNEAGEPYHPSTLTKLWSAAIRDLDVPQVRLHDARHTCATLMHPQNVPIAMVAAWLGHTDVSFTLRTYVHAQPEA